MEAERLATVSISLVRGQTERLRPPRALYCGFPLGRPLGKPGDPAFQRRVLEAVFALLKRPSGPVLEDFPEVIRDTSDLPLACALPPRYDPALPREVDEAIALRSAYNRQRQRSGRTNLRRVSPDDVPAAVGAFLRVAQGVPWQEAGLPSEPRQTALDIRIYYEEAALTLAEHIPGARSADAWFFRSTATGRMLKAAQAAMRESGAGPEEWYYMIPVIHQEG